jgi:hypothetical protein
VVELGSTPQRLEALLDGRCDATMLNAGNDLRARAAGLPCLGLVTDVARPYLGTVLAVHGPPTEQARRLATALTETADDLLAGATSRLAVDVVEQMGFAGELARSYAALLVDPGQGVVAGGDVSGLASVVALRRRHQPCVVDGRDVLAGATEDGSGLVDRRASG